MQCMAVACDCHGNGIAMNKCKKEAPNTRSCVQMKRSYRYGLLNVNIIDHLSARQKRFGTPSIETAICMPTRAPALPQAKPPFGAAVRIDLRKRVYPDPGVRDLNTVSTHPAAKEWKAIFPTGFQVFRKDRSRSRVPIQNKNNYSILRVFISFQASRGVSRTTASRHRGTV